MCQDAFLIDDLTNHRYLVQYNVFRSTIFSEDEPDPSENEMLTKARPSKATGYQAPAVHKAFQMLRVVAESEEPLGLTELAVRLGYSKSTTHGLVHALIREGALVQDPDGRKLFIGSTVANLAFSSWNYLKMTESAQPIINGIRDQIKETVFLGAMINSRVLILATAEAEVPLKISASPGTRMPLFAGAVGKAFLANQSNARALELIREIGLPKYTPWSITDENAYLDELDRVRANGYAVDDGEYLTGVCAVVVPLDNFNGPPMAVWVVGLSNTMGREKIQRATAAIMASTKDLRNVMID
jgi:DNA-binding IclR family transcriptional regulator